MEKLPHVILAGLPGKMATMLVEPLRKAFDLAPFALTGLDEAGCQELQSRCELGLIPPRAHEAILGASDDQDFLRDFVIVDFTVPEAVNRNAEMYARRGIPFVMGTTGGDREKLVRTVKEAESGICAVIAPNMALPIVVLQAMMEYAAATFPGAFTGFDLSVMESHQAVKKDTSGTAKAMVSYFNALGIPFGVDEIKMIRDAYTQKNFLGVPEKFLGGHGWHRYKLQSREQVGGNIQLSLEHNINGRQAYVDGAIKAVKFLAQQVAAGEKNQVYSMIDVAKAL